MTRIDTKSIDMGLLENSRFAAAVPAIVHRESAQVRHALTIAEAGQRLSREDALELAQSAGTEALLAAASSLRNRSKGKVVSYSRKAFLPLTTLCRDRCGYCTFRRDPGDPGGEYMTPTQVVAAAERAKAAGCKELLFSLGDQPEVVFPEARDFLRSQGFERTLEYLAAMCKLALEHSGLLPHANPGLMSEADLRALRPYNASMGLMLENISSRLLRRDQAHWQAPDKAPRLRLRTLEGAGKLQIAFTTGILIGIGETREERIDSLLGIREVHDQYGHIQEVIVQNFRAKPETRMAQWPHAEMEEMLRTLALARLILGGEMNLQAPPNLSSLNYVRLLDGGINDWGGISPITPDFINPEAAWPHIQILGERTADAGFELRERLAIYPEFIRGEKFAGFFDPNMRPHVERLAGEDGYAVRGQYQEVAS